MSGNTYSQGFPQGEERTGVVEITIPGTRDGNILLTKEEQQTLIDETARFLSGRFGGATVIPAQGFWLDRDNQLVREPVTLAISYSIDGELSKADIQSVIDYAQQLKRRMGQEAVLIRINGAPGLV